MSITKSGQLGGFRCRKRKCKTKEITRSKDTWFENVRLPINKVFMLMYCFTSGFSYEQAYRECCDEVGDKIVTYKTIMNWYSHCRETILQYMAKEVLEKIGGPGRIVQIDESKFIKSQGNSGLEEGKWVIGMIEDGSEDLRLEVCPDNERSAEVLVPLIQKHVKEGSIIHTDSWTAYNCLGDYGYIHKKVNRDDPEQPGGINTQRIKSHWRALKLSFRKDSHKINFTDWLAEYRWRRNIRIKKLDPFEELLKCIHTDSKQ